MTSQLHDVTIAIPSMMSGPGLERTVRSALDALRECGPNSEVLVVANGPMQDPRWLPIRDRRLRVFTVPQASAPFARNLAIEQSACDRVLFSDDDCVMTPKWARKMACALQEQTVVCAPVRVAEVGPVTAYLNYQRFFDAPALSVDRTRYLITANCGIRKDWIPSHLRFDPNHFNNAAEDADFGYRLRESGIELTWLPEALVVHRLNEDVGEITRRFVRYGKANAVLVSLHDRWEEAAPTGLQWLASIRAGEYRDRRRFVEILDDGLARKFATFDLARIAAFLVGYLVEVSQQTGCALVDVDEDAFHLAWSRHIPGVPPTEERAVDTAHDVRRFAVHRGRGPDDNSAVARLLQTTVRVMTDADMTCVTAVSQHAHLLERHIAASNARLFELWDDHGSEVVTMDDVERLARAAGVAVSDAAHDLEKRGRSQLAARTEET